MKKTRQKILDEARRLFNELGYSQVTIRMIASALGMSSGNLNYHFRKREDILEALYFEMVEVFDRRIQVLGDQEITLDFMKLSVQQSMNRMIEYRFVWTDLFNLLKSNQKIKTHFESVKQERIKGSLFVYNYFIQQGILEKPSFSKEYLFLAERMIGYGNTWLYASNLYEDERKKDELIQHSSFQLLSILYPYLTPKGKEEFIKIYPEIISS